MKHTAIAAALCLVLGLLACNQPTTTARKETPAAKPPAATTAPESTAARPPSIRDIAAAPPLMKFTGTPYLTINVKDYGTIRIKLDPKAAPQNVSNVYQLAKGGFYDGIVFHRIMKGFMIQTGDPTGTGAGGPRYTVPAEFKLTNVRGAVAMARQGDQVNPAKASSSCQFYIVHKDAPFLDKAGYTVIGNVVEGLGVVDKIAESPVKASPMGEMSSPVTPVVIDKVTVEEKPAQ